MTAATMITAADVKSWSGALALLAACSSADTTRSPELGEAAPVELTRHPFENRFVGHLWLLALGVSGSVSDVGMNPGSSRRSGRGLRDVFLKGRPSGS